MKNFKFSLLIAAVLSTSIVHADWLIKSERKATNMKGEPLSLPPVKSSPERHAPIPMEADETATRTAPLTSPPQMSDTLPLKHIENQSPLDPASEEIVIIQTEQGFIPSQVRLRQGSRYRLHIVNLNSAQKNVSFVMDRYSQFHGTFFGQRVSFDLAPAETGVFSFVSPETAKHGKIVVLEAQDPTVNGRMPASVSSEPTLKTELPLPTKTIEAADLKVHHGKSR